MKLEYDTLKHVKILTRNGLKKTLAESKEQAKQKALEFEKHYAQNEKRIAAEIAEARAGRRLVVGTIITCTLALAGLIIQLMRTVSG